MNNLKYTFSQIILAFINFVFIFKYLSRISNYSLVIALTVVFLQILFFQKYSQLKLPTNIYKFFGWGLICGLICFAVVCQFVIPVENLHVDRWSVVSSFFTELFNGHYPYFAKSHLGNPPGPMPAYFMIVFLFYLLGDISYLSALGYIIFVVILIRKLNVISVSRAIIFFIASAAFMYWEITTRSNIFTNSVLVLLMFISYEGSKPRSNLKFILLGLIAGLLLSTRSVFILVYIPFFLFYLINKQQSFKQLFAFGMLALLGFIITFIPFILFFWKDFLVINPFVIQSSFLIPPHYVVIFIIISLVLAFFVKKSNDKYFFSGLSIFVPILIYALYHLIKSGYQSAFLDGKADISYFIFCVPFFLWYILKADYRCEELI